MEKSSILRTSPKSETKGSGNPIAIIKITGENEGIREYMKLYWVGKKTEKFLEKLRQESDELEEINLLKALGVIKVGIGKLRKNVETYLIQQRELLTTISIRRTRWREG